MDRSSRKMQLSLILSETQIFFFQNRWLLFIREFINRKFSTRKKYFDFLSMHAVPCNGNVMGETNHILNFVMIRLDYQTQFFSEQVSGFLLSTSQSTVLFLYKMIQFAYVFCPFFH